MSSLVTALYQQTGVNFSNSNMRGSQVVSLMRAIRRECPWVSLDEARAYAEEVSCFEGAMMLALNNKESEGNE